VKRGTVIVGVLAALTALASSASANGAVVGHDSVFGSANGDNAAGEIQAYRYQATASGDVDRLNAYLTSGNTAETVKLGLYSDLGDQSQAEDLLGSCTVENPVGNDWNSCLLNADVNIADNGYYWLAIMQPCGDSGHLEYAEGAEAGVDTYTPTRLPDESDPAPDPCADRWGYLKWADYPAPWGSNKYGWHGYGSSLYADHSAEFPDASNTGVPDNVTLRDVTPNGDGNYVVNTENAVVDGIRLLGPGCVLVKQPGVTIKNSKLGCVIQEGTATQDPANLPTTIQDTEINCSQTVVFGKEWISGIVWQNLVVLRADVSRCSNAIQYNDHLTVKDSYFHDLTQCQRADCTLPDGPDPDTDPDDDVHTDGIQGLASGSDTVIEHNTIEGWTEDCGGFTATFSITDGRCNGTSAININHNPSGPTTNNLLVKDNLLSGGAIAIYCPINKGTNVEYIGNHLSTVKSASVGAFGISFGCAGVTQAANVIHETGQAVTLGN
jgi:hypothetical protein